MEAWVKWFFSKKDLEFLKPSGRRHDQTWNSISSQLEVSGTLGWVWTVVPNHVKARLRLRILKRPRVYFWFGFVVVTIVFLNLGQGWFREVYFCGTDCMHSPWSRQGHSCLFIVFLLVYAHLSSFHIPTPLPYAANHAHLFHVCTWLNSLCPTFSSTQNVTLFRIGSWQMLPSYDRSHWIQVGPKSNMTGVLIRREKLGHTDMQRRKTEGEIGVMHLQAKEQGCQQPPKQERGRNAPHSDPPKGTSLPTLWFHTSPERERMNFCCLSHPICDIS